MPRYDVYVFCDACNDSHPIGIRIGLYDGPAHKESIGNLYAGKELPESIARFIDNVVHCPNTGSLFVQEDNHQVFLVPIGN